MPIVDLESLETHREYALYVDREEVESAISLEDKEVDTPQAIYQSMKESHERRAQLAAEMLEMGYQEVVDEQFASNSTQEKREMLFRRNMEMALTTDRLIRRGYKPFCLPGLFHFAGEDGMQKLMEKMGYTVTQIICEEPRFF